MKEHTGRPRECYGCGTDVVIKGNAPEPINLLGYVCEMGAVICAKCLFSLGDPTDPFDQFEAYATIADQLIDELSKAQLAECARMLALHLADYQHFGEIPHAGDVVQIGDEQAALLRDGVQVLVDYLGNVRDGVSEGPATQRGPTAPKATRFGSKPRSMDLQAVSRCRSEAPAASAPCFA